MNIKELIAGIVMLSSGIYVMVWSYNMMLTDFSFSAMFVGGLMSAFFGFAFIGEATPLADYLRRTFVEGKEDEDDE